MSSIFDLTAERFSRATALSLAQFSDLAYRDPGEIRAVLTEGGMQMKWIQDAPTDTQAFIAWNDDVTVVAFRGTENVESAITDMKVKRIPYLAGPEPSKVHFGFMFSWDAVRASVLSHILEHCPKQQMLTTGHSLGGALAALCADDLCGLGGTDRKVRVYTFGQPRLWDAVAANGLNARATGWHRFVHNNDIVPRIPFAHWGYRHAGRLNHIDHTGRVLVDPASWMVLADRIIGRFKSRKLNPLKWTTDGIDDHSMKHYLRLVGAWAGRE